jgi:hypothetical protein
MKFLTIARSRDVTPAAPQSQAEHDHICAGHDPHRYRRLSHEAASFTASPSATLKVFVVRDSPIAPCRALMIERVGRVRASEVVMAGLVLAIHDFPNVR